MTTATFYEIHTEKRTHCPLCNEPLANENECSKCDWVRGPLHPDTLALSRRDTAAALLSLAVPGLGHLYKGQDKIALTMLGGAMIASVFAVAFFPFVFPVPASPILLACYWCFAAIHACAADDLAPASGDLIWKMIAMLVAGFVGAMTTLTVAFHLLRTVL